MGYIYQYGNYQSTKYKIYYRTATGWDNLSSLDELTQYTTGTYLTGVHVFGVMCGDGYALKGNDAVPNYVTRYRAGEVTSSTATPSAWEQAESGYSYKIETGLFKFVGFAQRFDGSSSWKIDFDRINAGLTEVTTDNFTITVTGTFDNVTKNFTDGQTVQSGTETTFTVTANSGYWFTQSTYTFMMDRDSGTYDIKGFTISADKYSLTWTGTIDGNVTFSGDYSAVPYPTASIGNYTSIYLLTDDDLNALSNITFVSVSSGEYPQLQQTYDGNNKFIVRLYKTPLPIPSDIQVKSTPIYLGAVDTEITSTSITSWNYTINFGTVTVAPKYGNVFDYINITAKMFIPYFGSVNVDINEIMDNTITLTGNYNLLEGSCTVRAVDKHSVIIYEKTDNICYNMPFFQSAYEYVSSEMSMSPVETILTPYIVITRKTPYPNVGFTGKTRYFKARLSDFEDGVYNVVMDISLSGDIPQEMQAEIREILGGGCFI